METSKFKRKIQNEACEFKRSNRDGKEKEEEEGYELGSRKTTRRIGAYFTVAAGIPPIYYWFRFDLGEGGDHPSSPLHLTPITKSSGFACSTSTLVGVRGRLYLLGGFGRKSLRYKKTVKCLDTNDLLDRNELSPAWGKVRSMLTPRCSPQAVVVDGKIYVFGGGKKYGEKAGPWAEFYDPTSKTWAPLNIAGAGSDDPLYLPKLLNPSCGGSYRDISVLVFRKEDGFIFICSWRLCLLYDVRSGALTTVNDFKLPNFPDGMPRPPIWIKGNIYTLDDFSSRISRYSLVSAGRSLSENPVMAPTETYDEENVPHVVFRTDGLSSSTCELTSIAECIHLIRFEHEPSSDSTEYTNLCFAGAWPQPLAECPDKYACSAKLKYFRIPVGGSASLECNGILLDEGEVMESNKINQVYM